MGKRQGRSLEIDPNASPAERPEEVAEGSNTLFDFSGDARIRVLRRDDKTQKFVSHGFLPVTASEEDVGAEWGGGRYRVQLIVPDGTGREVIKTQREFDLPGSYRPPVEMSGVRPQIPGTKGVPVIPFPTPGIPAVNDMASMLNATVMTTFMDLIKTMKEVSTRPAQSVDPMMLELIRSQGVMQTEILKLLLQKDGNKGDSKKEFLDLMTSFKEIIGSPQVVNPSDPSKVLEGIVSAIRQLRDVSDDLSPEKGGTGDPLVDSLPKLTEILFEEQQMRKRQMLPAGQKPSQQPPQQQQHKENPPQEAIPIWRRIVKAQGPQLLMSAKTGKDPELIANIAVSFASDEVKGVLKEFFRQPAEEAAAQIISEEPGLAEFPGWMYQFVEQVQFRLLPEEFDVDDEDYLEDDSKVAEVESEATNGADN